MSHGGGWLELLRAFVSRRTDGRSFHDRFLDRWRVARDRAEPLPVAIDDLFYVVEAYCPDPTLRTPGIPFEADEAELRNSAETALARLESLRPSGKLT
ncbi:MAG: colicin immunity domain-containing protein [Hyphomicrobiaceae bacterium]